jgi:hypothetical protein
MGYKGGSATSKEKIAFRGGFGHPYFAQRALLFFFSFFFKKNLMPLFFVKFYYF